MRIETDPKLDFSNVLIKPKRSTLTSRNEVSLDRTYTFKHTGTSWTGVPIAAANMDTTGTFEMAKVMSANNTITCIHKYYSPQEWETFALSYPEFMKNVAITIGLSVIELDNASYIIEKFSPGFICLDVANGYTEKFVNLVRKVRAMFPKIPIIAGNVVTAEMTEELILSGADIVKVGIGSGSVCTTRKMAGVGYPQLSAIIECADAAHGLGGLVMSDGGCTVVGDIAKAFGGGADFVMLGGMLAGHTESAGDMFVDESGKKFKIFYGMSSATAMEKYVGGVASYRAAEGKTVKLAYRGDLQNTLNEIAGGLRSTCTYVGAICLKELSKRTTFIMVSQQLNTVFGNS